MNIPVQEIGAAPENINRWNDDAIVIINWKNFDLSLDFINASLNINPFDAIGYDFDWFPSRLQQQRSNKGTRQPLL